MIQTLTLRQLDGATLAWQLLLARQDLDPVEAVERVAVLHAQEPPASKEEDVLAAEAARLEAFLGPLDRADCSTHRRWHRDDHGFVDRV